MASGVGSGLDFTFTQTSPADDSLTLGPTGLVTGLHVDSTASATFLGVGLFVSDLGLNLNGTWDDIVVPPPGTGGQELTNGTYTITPIAAVPEPATFGLFAAGLAALGLGGRGRVRRARCFRS